MSDKELVWLPKELAEKVKQYNNDDLFSKKAEEIILDYLKKSESEIKTNLEQLDENVLMYKGLMIKAKQEFKKAADEQIDSSYKLWEEFDKQRPQIQKKIDSLKATIDPLKNDLNHINDMLQNIRIWNLKELLETLSTISHHLSLNSDTGKMLKFLVKNYGAKQ